MKSTEKLAGIVEKFTEDANRSVNVAAIVVAGGAVLLLATWLWIIMVMWAINHWQHMMLIILGFVAVFAALAIWGMLSSTDRQQRKQQQHRDHEADHNDEDHSLNNAPHRADIRRV